MVQSVYIAKTKALISCAGTYANCWFSDAAAHIIVMPSILHSFPLVSGSGFLIHLRIFLCVYGALHYILKITSNALSTNIEPVVFIYLLGLEKPKIRIRSLFYLLVSRYPNVNDWLTLCALIKQQEMDPEI